MELRPVMIGQTKRSCPTLVVGVGNEFRDDDALGLLVVRELRRRTPEGVCVAELSGEGAALIEAWRGMERVFIIDAIVGPVPGRLHRIDARAQPVPRGLFHYSSHAFGVAEAIETARVLGSLPPVTVLYGIEGEAFDPGVGLSDPVVRSIPALITAVQQDLERAYPVTPRSARA